MKTVLRLVLSLLLCFTLCSVSFMVAGADISTDGDIDENGVLDGSDLVALQKAVLLCEYDYDSARYDVLADGSINVLDFIRLKKLVANFINVTTFLFGENEVSDKKKNIGGKIYVMPNVSAVTDEFGSIALNGATVYYTKVDAYTSDGVTAHSKTQAWNMCYPVFENVVTIKDKASAVSAETTYDSKTQKMPSGLSLTAYSEDFIGSVAPDGEVGFASGGAKYAFAYDERNVASSSASIHNKLLVYKSPTLSNQEIPEKWKLVEYKYEAIDGTVYYYLVGYHSPKNTDIK